MLTNWFVHSYWCIVGAPYMSSHQREDPMKQATLLLIMLSIIAQGPRSQLAIPTKINAVPADSFRGGNTITMKATFAKALVPPVGPLCRNRSFVVRLYDAKLVENEQPRISPDTTHPDAIKPVTPYLQQSPAPYEPLSGPNELTIEKTFEPFVLPANGRIACRGSMWDYS